MVNRAEVVAAFELLAREEDRLATLEARPSQLLSPFVVREIERIKHTIQRVHTLLEEYEREQEAQESGEIEEEHRRASDGVHDVHQSSAPMQLSEAQRDEDIERFERQLRDWEKGVEGREEPEA